MTAIQTLNVVAWTYIVFYLLVYGQREFKWWKDRCAKLLAMKQEKHRRKSMSELYPK